MKYIAALFFLVFAVPAFAAQNYTANSTTYDISGTTNFSALTNSSLIPQNTGTVAYCHDCTQTAICAGGGSGALAIKIGSGWQCGTGISTSLTGTVLPGKAGQVATYTSSSPTLSGTNSVNGEANLLSYGNAVNDVKFCTGVATMTAGNVTLTCSNGPFAPGDVSKIISVNGNSNQVLGPDLNTTIATYISPTQVNLALAPSACSSSGCCAGTSG